MKYLLKPHIALVIIFSAIFFAHLNSVSELSRALIPETIYQYKLKITFETDSDVEIHTFLPAENEHQEILDETILAKELEIEEKSGIDGRYVTWRGDERANQIEYSSLLSLQSARYQISRQLNIPDDYAQEVKGYLSATPAIPVNHPEIKALWEKIKPEQTDNLYGVLQAIYTYNLEQIETLPFKGLTDSLTALRLESASCNGKSRLFISLARLNNLPSRLVGGVILNNKKKKTSHQWVEVYINGHWVPFDTTNAHFAYLPENYVELYRGDHNLFRHSSNINFDYFFQSNKENLSPALFRQSNQVQSFIPNAAQSLQQFGLSIKSSYIFLLLPLCTLIIAFLRNIIGINTFGVFMPMLIAAACIFTGFWLGLIGFFFVLLLAFIGHEILGRFHVLKVPRLASIITLLSIVSLIGISRLDSTLGIEFGILALFPTVIISFTADRIHQMSDEKNWPDLIKNALGTLLTIFLCYLALNSILLQGLFALYPELLILVLAALVYIGNWTGIRVTEVFRFRNLIDTRQHHVMGLNERNKDYIYKENEKPLLKLAADKISTKNSLKDHNIPCPATLAICRNYAEIDGFMDTVNNFNNFVVKPNNGSRGNGIVIFTGRHDEQFITASGKSWSTGKLKKHVGEILSGNFAQNGEEDVVFVEPIIKQHDFLNRFNDLGLSDIRIIIRNGTAISAMLRVPTSQSNGKANLHQAAVGVSVDIDSGTIGRAVINGEEISHHPDSQAPFEGIKVPYWNKIVDIAQNCYLAIPLGYMGVDICIDATDGPLVLEVNGRPGLEIQNVQNIGMNQVMQEAFRHVQN